MREPALEPDDGTMVPPPARDGEPHFRRGAAEPFAAAPLHDEEAFAVVRETRAPNSHRTGWRIVGGLVALLLLVALLAQLAWWQRETVMVYAPRTQMLFAQACAQLGCKVAPPRDIDGLLVEPSDLRQVDGPHKLELKMPLHNRSSVALAYPAVELTLLDEHNNIAVRRVLWPQDYVRPGTPIAAGLPPRGDRDDDRAARHWRRDRNELPRADFLSLIFAVGFARPGHPGRVSRQFLTNLRSTYESSHAGRQRD